MNHLTWRKSTFSVSTQQCVELADIGATVLMRDSKHPDSGHLTLTSAQLAALLDDIKAGHTDHLA